MKITLKPVISLFVAALMLLTSIADGAFGAAGYPNPGRDSSSSPFVAGAYIIDSGAVSAGATKQTVGQGLKPYGLVYALLKAKIEVDWVINPSKAAIDQTLGNAGTDFTFDCDGTGTAYASKAYRTGAFVIPKEFAAQAKPIIDSWKSNSANAGLTVDGPCTAETPTLPIFSRITSWPRTSLDAQNGSVAVTYYTNAGIAQGSLTDPMNPPAYRYASPSQLTTCDDLYVMPHADPTYATHKDLKTFVLNGGSFYASCHAVSVVENMEYPTGTKYMNFLSSNGLINYDAHSQGTVPYNFYKPSSETQAFKGSNNGSTLVDLESVRAGDPIAQFLGVTSAATQAGSEQIFIPKSGSYWRPTTQIIQYDSTQANATATNGPASSLLYGPAFGDTTGANGWVMYQGGHSVAKGSVDDVAAQRAFFNMVLLTAVDRRPAGSALRSRSPIVAVTEPAAGVTISGGSSVPVAGTATGGSGSYTYKWTAACYDQAGAAITGGTFADDTAANTTFTAPVVAGKVNCNMTLTVVDTCGRFSFGVQSVVFAPNADLTLTKTVDAATSSVGGTLTYTLTLKNNGKIAGTADGAIHTAQDVKIVDPIPTGLTFVSVSAPSFTGTAPAGSHCDVAGSVVECNIGSLLDEQTVTVVIKATVNSDQGGHSITNRASASSSSADNDPASNTSSVTTTISNDGIQLVVTRDKPIVDAAGQSVVYTYTLNNIGTSPISSITVTDKNGSPATPADITPTYVSGDSNSNNVLETTEHWVYTNTRTVSSASNDADNDGKTTTKRTTAVAVGSNGANTVSATGEVTVQVVTPSLEVTKTADSSKIESGGTANFTLKVKNTSNGPAKMTNITVTDSYNIGGTLTCKVLGDEITPTTANFPAGLVTYTIASLDTGAEWDARCSIKGVTTAGTNVLLASATNPLNPSNTVNATGSGTVAITIGAPALQTAKSASIGSARKGESFYYRVSATNTSGSNMTNVKLTDQIPSNLTVNSVTRNYVSTSSSGSGDAKVVAWDRFSSGSGSGWDASSWTFSSNASINSSKVEISLQTGSTATPYFQRTVVIGRTNYPQLHINLSCYTDNSTGIVPEVKLIPSSGSDITLSPNSGQLCNTSSTMKGINYKVDTSLLSASDSTYTLKITAPNVSSSGKKLKIDDVTINSGQIAFDPTNSSSDGLGFSNNWTLTAGSNSSSKFKISSSSLYLDKSSTNVYSGTATRNLTIAAEDYTNVKLTFLCKHSSFSSSSDKIEIKVSERVVFTETKDTTQKCSSSSSTFVTPLVITESGDVQISISIASSNKEIWLSDFTFTGQTKTAVSSSTKNLTIDALGDANGATTGTPGYTLTPGQRIEFLIYVTVDSIPDGSQEIVNTASATSDQQADPSKASVSVVMLSAGFTIKKTVSSNPIRTGTAVTYTYVVSNTGNTSIQGIVVSDSNGGNTINVLTNASPSAYTSGAVTDSVKGSGVSMTTNDVDNRDWVLDPNEVWTLTVSSGNLTTNTPGTVTLNGYEQVEVDDGLGNANSITITPTALLPETDALTVIVIAPALTVTVTPTSSSIYTNRTVTYTYTVTNTGTGGNGIANVVVISQNCPSPILESGDTNHDEILQSTETWIFKCTTPPIAGNQTGQAVVVNGTDNTLGSTVISNTVNVAVNVFAPGQIALTRSVTNSTVGATSPSTDVSGVQKLQASLTNTLSFTYQVTLVGTTTVTAATSYEGFIVDDNCASISFVSGDSASTLTLNVGETWTFKCDLSANQSMRIISSATAYATDGAGVLVHSAAKKADIEILTPSLITKIVPATEYVKYGGSDVFTYSVENNGGTDITAFTVADDSCSPLVRSSVTAAEGFTANNDNVLDIGEIWNYSCTRTNYTADHMSNFTVSGVTDSLGYNGYTPAPANALVFVIDPTMTVAQTATVYDPGTFTNKANPGTATQGPATQVNANVNDVVVYTYSINSANTTHSTSVAGLNTMLINSITDSRCSPIEPVDRNADTYNDGDSNSNGQLDPGETWLFDCNTVQVTASPAVVDAQATVEAASVASNFTLRPASVRVIVAGATPTATPAPASSEEPSATPTPTVKPTPKPTVTPTPNPTKAAPKKLTLKVYFKGDSPVLTAAAKADLRILAQKAKSYGFATSISSIGRVKETNDKSYDIRLSKQRATNVANYLKTLGVKGSYKLVAAGISPENTAISRRVDLTLQWSAK